MKGVAAGGRASWRSACVRSCEALCLEAPYEAGLKRANKKVVKVTGGEGGGGGCGATEGKRWQGGKRWKRRRQGVRLPRAASSFSFAFTSSSPSPSRIIYLFQPPPSASLTPPRLLSSIHFGRSSSVPQYVTTTRHTLLVGAQDNCPHYSYLKSAPRARTRATAAASNAIEPPI